VLLPAPPAAPLPPPPSPVHGAQLALPVQLERHLDAGLLVRGHVDQRRLAPVQLLVQVEVLDAPASAIVGSVCAHVCACSKQLRHARFRRKGSARVVDPISLAPAGPLAMARGSTKHNIDPTARAPPHQCFPLSKLGGSAGFTAMVRSSPPSALMKISSGRWRWWQWRWRAQWRWCVGEEGGRRRGAGMRAACTPTRARHPHPGVRQARCHG